MKKVFISFLSLVMLTFVVGISVKEFNSTEALAANEEVFIEKTPVDNSEAISVSNDWFLYKGFHSYSVIGTEFDTFENLDSEMYESFKYRYLYDTEEYLNFEDLYYEDFNEAIYNSYQVENLDLDQENLLTIQVLFQNRNEALDQVMNFIYDANSNNYYLFDKDNNQTFKFVDEFNLSVVDLFNSSFYLYEDKFLKYDLDFDWSLKTYTYPSEG